jgi:hypothetical protein
MAEPAWLAGGARSCPCRSSGIGATDASSHVGKKEGGPLKEGGVSLTPAFTPPALRLAVPDYREEEYPGCGLISAHTLNLT